MNEALEHFQRRLITSENQRIDAIARRVGDVALILEPHLMDKMQEMIDKVFGQLDAQRGPQQPSELTVAREQELAERTKKVEALRKARLARDAAKH